MRRAAKAAAKRRRARTTTPTRLALGEQPETSGDRRAALLMACYRAAAEHEDHSLALLALKLRRFSGPFKGGRISFQAEGACLVGVCGRLADLAHHVSTEALERSKNSGPLLEGVSNTSLRLATLAKDALLAAEELETLRLAYTRKKAAPARG
ncbi:MAG TPA: hypothetical protein VFS43_20755 [Polyangiaceae bacterium]|nr:hypothetical protein [Polyangiaceae bacterium]